MNSKEKPCQQWKMTWASLVFYGVRRMSTPPIPKNTKFMAIKLVLREGGPDGQPRAEGAIDDFKRAVRHWHARLGLPGSSGKLPKRSSYRPLS
jgi:hypothetical protein